MVLQDTLLFSTSIRENIGYGREGASNAEIVEAAKRAQAYAWEAAFLSLVVQFVFYKHYACATFFFGKTKPKRLIQSMARNSASVEVCDCAI